MRFASRNYQRLNVGAYATRVKSLDSENGTTDDRGRIRAPNEGICRLSSVVGHHTPAHIRPGLSTPLGSKLSLTRLVRAATAAACGSNTSTAARSAAGARMRVACPPVAATA